MLGRINAADPLASLTTFALPTGGSTPMGLASGPNGAIWLDESSIGKVATFGWDAKTTVITPDPNSSPLLDGDTKTSIRIDPAAPCNCGQDTRPPSTGKPGRLVYNSRHRRARCTRSSRRSSRPDPNVLSLPTQIQITLTWNGVTQSTETFLTNATSPGGAYLTSVQVANPVTATGFYPYQVDIQARLQDGDVVEGTTGGLAYVTVNGSTDPLGRGWSLGGSAKLVPDGQGGYFWVDGDGGVRDLQAGAGNTFVSPPNDFGTLVQNAPGTFTYTDPQQDKSSFTTIGGQILLTSIVQPDGPTETFSYNASGAPTSVTVPGGSTATFNYDASGELEHDLRTGRSHVDVHL